MINIIELLMIILGVFVGQMTTRYLLYKFVHPYIVVPYLNKRKIKGTYK